MHRLIAWALAFILSHPTPSPKCAPETPEEALIRLESIARDLVEVVYDENEPTLFEGEQGRSKTLRILQGIAFHESGGFRKDVDLGIGSESRGQGSSVCLMQINVGKGRTTKWNRVKKRYAYDTDSPSELENGYTAADLLRDRKACFRTALRLAKYSFVGCGYRVPLEYRLRLYASGNCERGGYESRIRMTTGLKAFEANKPDFSDTYASAVLSTRQESVIFLSKTLE